MNTRKAAIVSLACCTLLTGQLGAAAAEIKVLSSAALKPVLDVVGPQFEQQSGHKLRVRYELTPAVKKLADEGEAFDLLIANPPHVDDLIAKNRSAAGSRIDIASFGVGVGVRSGSARPDASSIEAFKRSLLGASSVARLLARAPVAHSSPACSSASGSGNKWPPG